MKKCLAIAMLATVLSSCAAQPMQYTAEGKIYPTAQSFIEGGDQLNRDAVASVVPLPQPVSRKNLVIAIPSERVMYDDFRQNPVQALGHQAAPEEIQAMSTFTYRSIRVFYEGVKKRNIYASTTFVDMDSISGTVAPSADTDVLYLMQAPDRSTQWFFATAKAGRQIFAYDRSPRNMPGRVNAFADAVQMLAIRE